MAERTKSSIGTLALKACATAVLLPMSVLCMATEGTEAGAGGEGKPLSEHQKEVTGAPDASADAATADAAESGAGGEGKPLTEHQKEVTGTSDAGAAADPSAGATADAAADPGADDMNKKAMQAESAGSASDATATDATSMKQQQKQAAAGGSAGTGAIPAGADCNPTAWNCMWHEVQTPGS